MVKSKRSSSTAPRHAPAASARMVYNRSRGATTMPSKPVWSEGLLVSQHHFQQQDRYHEVRLEERLAALHRYGWGITVLEIDDRSLVSGQFRLKRLSAI